MIKYSKFCFDFLNEIIIQMLGMKKPPEGGLINNALAIRD